MQDAILSTLESFIFILLLIVTLFTPALTNKYAKHPHISLALGSVVFVILCLIVLFIHSAIGHDFNSIGEAWNALTVEKICFSLVFTLIGTLGYIGFSKIND